MIFGLFSSDKGLSLSQKILHLKNIHNYSVRYLNAQDTGNNKEMVKNQMYAVSCSFHYLQNEEIVKEFSLDKEKLDKIVNRIYLWNWPEDVLFGQLLININTNLDNKNDVYQFYIPFATICYPQTLRFVLENEESLNMTGNQVGPISLLAWFSKFDGDGERAPDVSS